MTARHHVGMTSDEFLPPIFHVSDDVASFESVEAMRRYIEPWDAEEGEVFDSHGRCITLRGVGVRRTRSTVGDGDNVVDLTASVDLAPDRLVEHLRDYICRVGLERFGLTQRDLHTMPLADLVAVVAPMTRTR